MSEQASKVLPHPKEESIQGDPRRQMNNNSHNLPSFPGMQQGGPRSYNAAPPNNFDGKQEPSHNNMMSKFPPNTGAPGSNNMAAPSQNHAPQQQQHEYGSQQGSAPGAGQGYGMAYWPNSSGQQNPQFPNQRDSHLPSPMYGSGMQPQQGYAAPFQPRPASSSSMPRTGSPHNDATNAPLPGPHQMHDAYNGQQQQSGANPAGYSMYVPQQYPGAPSGQPGQASVYGGPGYSGGYPQQYATAQGAAGASGPNAPYGAPGGMYGNPVPHSREGSQDASQWRNSPYGPATGYPGSYAPYPGAAVPAQQSPYSAAGRAGRGASNTGERPFKCDQCPQSFQRSHDLKRHKRIHLAIKPFPCPSCDKSFSRKDALKRHILVKGCGNTSS